MEIFIPERKHKRPARRHTTRKTTLRTFTFGLPARQQDEEKDFDIDKENNLANPLKRLSSEPAPKVHNNEISQGKKSKNETQEVISSTPTDSRSFLETYMNYLQRDVSMTNDNNKKVNGNVSNVVLPAVEINHELPPINIPPEPLESSHSCKTIKEVVMPNNVVENSPNKVMHNSLIINDELLKSPPTNLVVESVHTETFLQPILECSQGKAVHQPKDRENLPEQPESISSNKYNGERHESALPEELCMKSYGSFIAFSPGMAVNTPKNPSGMLSHTKRSLSRLSIRKTLEMQIRKTPKKLEALLGQRSPKLLSDKLNNIVSNFTTSPGAINRDPNVRSRESSYREPISPAITQLHEKFTQTVLPVDSDLRMAGKSRASNLLLNICTTNCGITSSIIAVNSPRSPRTQPSKSQSSISHIKHLSSNISFTKSGHTSKITPINSPSSIPKQPTDSVSPVLQLPLIEDSRKTLRHTKSQPQVAKEGPVANKSPDNKSQKPSPKISPSSQRSALHHSEKHSKPEAEIVLQVSSSNKSRVSPHKEPEIEPNKDVLCNLPSAFSKSPETEKDVIAASKVPVENEPDVTRDARISSKSSTSSPAPRTNTLLSSRTIPESLKKRANTEHFTGLETLNEEEIEMQSLPRNFEDYCSPLNLSMRKSGKMVSTPKLNVSQGMSHMKKLVDYFESFENNLEPILAEEEHVDQSETTRTSTAEEPVLEDKGGDAQHEQQSNNEEEPFEQINSSALNKSLQNFSEVDYENEPHDENKSSGVAQPIENSLQVKSVNQNAYNNDPKASVKKCLLPEFIENKENIDDPDPTVSLEKANTKDRLAESEYPESEESDTEMQDIYAFQSKLKVSLKGKNWIKEQQINNKRQIKRKRIPVPRRVRYWTGPPHNRRPGKPLDLDVFATVLEEVIEDMKDDVSERGYAFLLRYQAEVERQLHKDIENLEYYIVLKKKVKKLEQQIVQLYKDNSDLSST